VILRNRWETEWRDNGYFYIPYKVFNYLVMDMWIGITQIKLINVHIKQAKTSKKEQKVPAKRK
jgi:C1A family cysteine protease